ncbi:hypothetical protein FHS29_007372 [Saccharothrix tamanrassetensis]|uniref:Uncharacterized protein n=1 Tax=Saccharothrix tamanrassetensis TaxID=1051531 RepID=A0A841CWQ8_9PSEU|nr:hypothetical protein [Saccharothrix tamanrassetensis]MBB5960744.1 hypothetical protein [Saccharothrix tamanrassetensis]
MANDNRPERHERDERGRSDRSGELKDHRSGNPVKSADGADKAAARFSGATEKRHDVHRAVDRRPQSAAGHRAEVTNKIGAADKNNDQSSPDKAVVGLSTPVERRGSVRRGLPHARWGDGNQTAADHRAKIAKTGRLEGGDGARPQAVQGLRARWDEGGATGAGGKDQRKPPGSNATENNNGSEGNNSNMSGRRFEQQSSSALQNKGRAQWYQRPNWPDGNRRNRPGH